MTEEQIRKNESHEDALLTKAREFMEHNYGLKGELIYIEGAHSRDEEIEQLKKAISSAQKAMAELAEMARNPWISVEESLPPEFKPVIVMFESGIIINAFVTMVKDEPAWHPSVEIPIGSDVIFWMQIPQIEKEEVQ